MSEEKNEIRLERKSKEEILAIKQQRRDRITGKSVSVNKRSSNANLNAEQRSKIRKLNLIQVAILIGAILVEVLSKNGYIPETVSIIGLVILTVSCLVILKKIRKILSK